jgi:hypothetical protein
MMTWERKAPQTGHLFGARLGCTTSSESSCVPRPASATGWAATSSPPHLPLPDRVWRQKWPWISVSATSSVRPPALLKALPFNRIRRTYPLREEVRRKR